MRKITLIATRHNENGLCNPQELVKIIEQINPDVIFEEIPPGKFEAVYAGTRKSSLEVFAIKNYLQSFPKTEHYPVDLDIEPELENRINMENKGIPFICQDYSDEYRHLCQTLNYYTTEYGFPFLNSDQCSEILARQKVLENQVLDALRNDIRQARMDHETLKWAYNQWLEQIDLRENEMLRNIYQLMASKKYINALFLIGAAHRKSIISKVSQFQKTEARQVLWVFKYFQ